ncbi:MAG: hypothetical protein ACT4P4_19485 [Betaproteobacteria bacterium]
MGRSDKGEGSYSGTRDYNARTRKFIESGRVKEAARRAAPRNQQEASEMRHAERTGRRRAKR